MTLYNQALHERTGAEGQFDLGQNDITVWGVAVMTASRDRRAAF